MKVLLAAAGDLRECAERLGYLFFRTAVDAAPVRRAVEKRLGLEWLQLQAAVMALPEVDALRRDTFVLGALREVFAAEPLPEQGDVLRVVRPGDAPTPAHSDGDYVPDPRLWTVWIPLGECPVELGGLAVEGPDGWASADYGAGDVLMFPARTRHRAGENRTQRVRLSIDFRYVPS